MAIIYSYPLNQPKRDDLLIGTITYDEDAINPVHGNPTVSFTIGSLLDLVSGQGNIQNLQQVTNIGNTTTNSIVISNNLLVSGGYYDSSNQPGTAGQLLSSTATGTQWVNTAQGVTSLTTNGTSGVSTLVGSVLNIPNYATAQDLDFSGDNGGTGSVDLDSQVFAINGTANQITTVQSGQSLTIALPTNITIAGNVNATTFVGNLTGDVTGGTISGTTGTFSDNVLIATDKKLYFNSSANLSLYHNNSTNGSIIENSQGDLTIQGIGLSDDVNIKSADDVKIFVNGTDQAIDANASGGVELFYSNSKKLETTSTGIYVTGSGVFTQDLWINTGQKLFFDNGSDCYISEDTTGRLKFVVDGSEFMRLGDGIPDTITFYKDSTFSGSLTSSGVLNVSGSGQDGYLYVSGNAGNPTSTAPTHAQGFAFAYNNSGGSRECEVFWNTGTTTAAINNVSYLGFYNEFLNSDAGNARVTDTQLKLYGTGELELVGATPTISNPYWRMPTTAAPNTGYVLAKANGSINLEWIANGGSIYQTTNVTVSAAQLSALNGSPITLLSAPGVGKTYYFNQIFFWFEAGSVVYNFGGMGTGIGFISVTGLYGPGYQALSDMDSASSSMVNPNINFNYMNVDPATANAAVILTPFQGTNPNPTQGNGILYVSISYEIKDLGPTIQAN
jgi:hypothetical protein